MVIQILKTNKKVPDVRPGDIVRVFSLIKEGKKEREQAFEGVVIKRSKGQENGASFTVRKISQGIGVERKFLIFSPLLTKVQVKKRAKVKRANLGYLRNVRQIAKKLKDKKIDPFEEALVVKVKEEKSQSDGAKTMPDKEEPKVSSGEEKPSKETQKESKTGDKEEKSPDYQQAGKKEDTKAEKQPEEKEGNDKKEK